MAAPASADRFVKRVRTSKAQVVQHIKTTRSLGSGYELAPERDWRIACTGFNKSRSGKARTWRCTYSYVVPRPENPERCVQRYRLGKVRRVSDTGVRYDVWQDDRLARVDCRPV